MLDMKVSQLTIDPLTNMPILILEDARGKESVPIWIGVVEASAIASELEKIQLARPMTHDLLKTILGECGVKVARVEIRDLRDGTFYASIFLDRSLGEPLVEVDARPSDAIALAMRTGAPIRVARKVIEEARKLDGNPAGQPSFEPCGGEPHCEGEPDPSTYRDLLESLADEDFGKWKM
ncbi:MAG: bifunctional nuclease family protein [Myxococcales bacterium]|nr:bifunctional nuclease family protein [Myxococcales bacterium]